MTMTHIIITVEDRKYTRLELYKTFKKNVCKPVSFETFFKRLQGLKTRELTKIEVMKHLKNKSQLLQDKKELVEKLLQIHKDKLICRAW